MIADHFPQEDLDVEEYEDYPHHLSVDDAQALANAYCIGNETMRAVKEAFDLAHDEWQAFYQVHSLRHNKPTLVDPNKTLEEASEELTQRQRRQATERKARQRHRRERNDAARKWWKLEDSLRDATRELQEDEYKPPRLQVTLSDAPDKPAAALYNAQDFHIGCRPESGADDFTVQAYCEGLMEKTEAAFEDALRLRRMERVYIVVGGDLVHVDGANAKTTAGTDMDLACSPTEALRQAMELMIRVVDLSRSVAQEVVLVPVRGNHDRALSAAAAMALAQRFHKCGNVRSLSMSERQYLTYYEHLICATHGDYSRKKMKRIGDTIRAEARDHLGDTSFTSLATGHLHHRARDVRDESGRVHYQAPSPVPTDRWHSKKAFVGSRKGVQLVLFDREGGGDRLLHA